MKNDAHYIRLRAAIEATLANVEVGPLSAMALAHAYRDFRMEAQQLDRVKEVGDEFVRLFPEADDYVRRVKPGSSASPYHANSALAVEVHALLVRLSGWLQGFSDEVALASQSRMYADSRHQIERT